jgi:hypothetical protein
MKRSVTSRAASGATRTTGRLVRPALLAGAVAALLAPAAAQAASGSGATASATEHFQAMSTNAVSSSRVVIGYGPVTGAGVDHESSNGMVETFVFAGGSFRLKVVKFTSSQRVSPGTCLITITRRATYRLAGGTGKYAGISGHGTAVAHILGVARRSGGKCALDKVPVAFEQTITAAGPIRL